MYNIRLLLFETIKKYTYKSKLRNKNVDEEWRQY
jgi:hypothetical protein